MKIYPKATKWCLIYGNRIVIIVIALIVAGGASYSLKLENHLRYPDEFDYVAIAQNIANSFIFSLDGKTPTCYRSPGYPGLLAIFIKLGANIIILRIINFVFFGLCIAIVYRLISRESTNFFGVLGTLFIVSYALFFYTASTLYPQILASFLFLNVIYLATEQNPKMSRIIIAGMLTGLLILVIPSFLFILPILGFWLLFEKGFKKHAKLVVKNLLKQGNLTPETIATVTAIPLETVDKISENIKRKKK